MAKLYILILLFFLEKKLPEVLVLPLPSFICSVHSFTVACVHHLCNSAPLHSASGPDPEFSPSIATFSWIRTSQLGPLQIPRAQATRLTWGTIWVLASPAAAFCQPFPPTLRSTCLGQGMPPLSGTRWVFALPSSTHVCNRESSYWQSKI